MRDYSPTIESQFANSLVVLRLIDDFNEWLDPRSDIEAFYHQVVNIDTAVGYGLDVWGRILGVGRVLNIAATKFFGFDEATTASADPFNQSPFYSGGTITANYALTDDGYRTLLLAKALANISNGSIVSINQILMTLFGAQGNCYVAEGAKTITYIFDFVLDPVQESIVTNSGVLPKTPGMAYTVAQSGT